jgi:dipeptidase E
MKFLLCSSGISNSSIEDALVELLGKPIGESSALCIPTGVQPFPGAPRSTTGLRTSTSSSAERP